MKKIYLLITSALLLIGSGTMWAANSGTASLNGGDPMGIADAISSWKSNGGTLQLLEDCEYETTYLSFSGKTWELDLNGQSLHINYDDSWGECFYITGGKLIINDGIGDGSFSADATNESLSYDPKMISLSNGPSLTINGGVFSITASNSGRPCYVLGMVTGGVKGEISINGGTFESNLGNCRDHIISGGKFKVKPADTAAAEGYVFMQNADGYYELVNGSYFAFIGGTGYSDVNAFNAALSEVASSPTEVTILAEKDVTIPANKYVTLKQYASLQENGTITNNGTVEFATNQQWNSGAFVNEGSGAMTISSGIFESTLYSALVPSVATIAEGCSAYTYYADNNYKQVLNNGDIVATVGSGDGLKVFTNLNTAISYSSESSPAVVIKNNANLSGPTVSDGSDKYLDLNSKTVEQTYRIKIIHGSLTIQGEGVINNTVTAEDNTAFWLEGTTSTTETNYSALTIGAGVTLNVPYGTCIGVLPSESNLSYGVVVNVNGTLTSVNSYPLYINGNVRGIEGFAPKFNITNGASIEAGCGVNGACIYAAGYGIWNIGAATLKANTPIYAKSGTININGATIEACGAYADPQPYGSGYYPTGDAIIFDSKNGYKGNMQLIVNDATITSANGYAVQEVLTDREESQTLSMTINGGKFKGEKGTIVVSEKFDESTPTRWANNSIRSGKYTSAPNDVADGYVVALNTDDDKAEYPYVVVADNTYPGDVTEIETNTTETSVVEIAENHGILVKSGVTYDVKGISFTGAKTRITVEPGATLIVGESGFIGSDAGRLLVLEADKANGTAKLKFNGTTEAASHVYAKVEQYMYSKALETGNLWQHIGIPTHATPVKISKTDPYMFNIWTAAKGWEYSGQVGVTSPWTGYNCATNRVTEGSKLTYEGTLEGKSPTKFVLEPNGYSCFANSFTAPMSILGFINSIPDGVSDNMVWIYKAADYDTEGLGFKQYLKSTIELEDNDCGIAPMQAFFLKNNTDAEVALNPVDYATAVLGFTPKGASADELNGGFIYISDNNQQARLQIIEKENLSDNFDPNYDGEQMVTDFIQIYVVQGDKKLSAIGTNSLEGKEITIVTKDATQYTLTFKSLKGNAFKLTDIVTGTEIEVGEGKTYTFTADANSTIKRFKLGEGEVSADEADANNVNVWVANNSMNIAGAAEGDAIEVINLAGVKVLSATATGEAVQTISLGGIASGAYIVKAGAATVKVIK